MPFGLNLFIRDLLQDVHNFQGGNIRHFSKNWFSYIRDSYILEIVSSVLKLELKQISCQRNVIKHPLAKSETAIISEEITKFLSKMVIAESYSEPEE